MVIELDDSGPEGLSRVWGTPNLWLLGDQDAGSLFDHVGETDRSDFVRGQVVDEKDVWLSEANN